MDERDLVEAARAGDTEAFRTLYQRYHRRAFALAYGVVHSHDDALDIVQDAFIKAHRYLDRFEGSSSFYTWLYRIVMNLCIDQLRKQRRNRPVELTDVVVGDGSTDGDVNPAGDALLPRILHSHPGRALADREIRQRLDSALAELSDNHRAVLVMRELDGLSYDEMAQVMGCSKGTIMSRLFHARRNMQRQLIDLIDNPTREVLAELGLDQPPDAKESSGG